MKKNDCWSQKNCQQDNISIPFFQEDALAEEELLIKDDEI